MTTTYQAFILILFITFAISRLRGERQRVRFGVDWAFPDEFGEFYRGDCCLEIKIGYWMFSLGVRPQLKGQHFWYPVGGDAVSFALRIDAFRLKFRANAFVLIDGWFSLTALPAGSDQIQRANACCQGNPELLARLARFLESTPNRVQMIEFLDQLWKETNPAAK